MADLTHTYGFDLTLTPQGGLSLSEDTALTQQNAIRRLLTTPGADLYDADYGAGLLAAVGSPLNKARMKSAILKNLRQEPTIDHTAPMSAEIMTDDTQSAVTVTVEFSDIYGLSSHLNLPLS